MADESSTSASIDIVPAVDGATAAEEEAVALSPEELAAAPFEVVLLVPNQTFIPIAAPGSKTRALFKSSFQELPFNVSQSDVIHELRSLIQEAPEGFWLGAFGLAPMGSVLLEEAKGEEAAKWGPWEKVIPTEEEVATGSKEDSKAWRLTSEGVLGDFSDLSGVFVGLPSTSRRGLQVVPTSFSHLAMSLHLLRLRESLYSNLPALTTGSVYDPTSLAISPGGSVYLDVRGKKSNVEEVEVESAEDGKKNKSKKASTTATSAAPTEVTPKNPFADWTTDQLNPYSAFDHLRPKSSSTLSTPCCKAFAVSPWSPPPHARRMRGDIVYLTFSTLEGESYHITGSTAGFWVSKSSATTFDPLPRVPAPRNLRSTPYTSLFELFAALSPTFTQLLSSFIEAQNPSIPPPNIYTTLAVTIGPSATPWLVPAPVHTADPFRSQLAYLLTSSTNAELLPPARDWIDEFGQFKEFPQSTIPEKLLRERLTVRVRADFNSAAIRGILSIANGDIPPLNPNDPPEGHTYVHNNMLFTRAEDAIGAFDFLGGHAAARVAASKDLAAVGAIEAMDIDQLSTLATTVVDFAGSRWVAQSILPGLFKTKDADEEAKKTVKDGKTISESGVFPAGDAAALEAQAQAKAEGKPHPSQETLNKSDYPPTATFRIVYGTSNPDEPEEELRSSAYFQAFAKQVAEKSNLAEHEVIDRNGKSTQLWTSSEMHGIAAADGRSYYLDCFRLYCVDVEFLENDLAATPASGNSAYPHLLVLLREELVRSYRDSKLQVWIEGKVAEAQASIAAAKSIEPVAGSVESELKEASSDSAAEKPAPAIINADDFILNFNPDAFVARKAAAGKDDVVLYNPEEESSKNVRAASLWLREAALPTFITEVVSIMLVVTDGIYLTKLMHRKGINMRYLGALVDLIDTKGPEMEYAKNVRKDEIEFVLRHLKSSLQHEMVSRACKHILNSLLRNSLPYDHPAVISHFFNCLLGASLEPNPSPILPHLPAGVNPSRSWASLTPISLSARILSEVATRYRYSLPAEFLTQLVPTKILREICIRVGIQLLLRPYDFGSSGTSSALLLNGDSQTEDEKVESSGGDGAAANKRKKKKGGAKVEIAFKAENVQLVSIRPEDVLNILPIVKSPVHKSALVEESFSAGQRAFDEGAIDFGQELITDALQMAEQIYGTVHYESATKYHALALMYNELATTFSRKIATHEKAVQALSEMKDETQREAATLRLQEHILPDLEATRKDLEVFQEQAVRVCRQSVIMAERTQGIDHPDTIQQYSDLALLEQPADLPAGLALSKHALNLWTAAYGPDHPTVHSILNNVAQMTSQLFGMPVALPLYQECRKLAVRIYGETSYSVAQADSVLAQIYGLMLGDIQNSHKFAEAAVVTFSAVLGDKAPETEDARSFAAMVADAMSSQEEERKAIAERMKLKLSNGGKESKVRAAVENGVAAPVETVAAVPVLQKAHGQKASLSLDELVNFIEGTPAAKGAKVGGATKKRKSSPGGKKQGSA